MVVQGRAWDIQEDVYRDQRAQVGTMYGSAVFVCYVVLFCCHVGMSNDHGCMMLMTLVLSVEATSTMNVGLAGTISLARIL